MATLMLMRMTALTDEEQRKLPPACEVVTDSRTVVARADVELPLSAMFKLAVAMARAVPDADFAFHEFTAPGVKRLLRPALPSAEVDSEDEVSYEEEIIEEPALEPNWWDFLEQGKEDEAARLLMNKQLSVDDRQMLRHFFQGQDVQKVVFVCQLARKLKWKSFVVSLRSAFNHTSPKVRLAAVKAVGDLSGPSMIPAVHLLTSDKDFKVRKAAKEVCMKLRRS